MRRARVPNLKIFMDAGGESFNLFRNNQNLGIIEGLPNHEKNTHRQYIGFYKDADVQCGDWVKGTISQNLFYIEDIKAEVVYGEVFQQKGYYLTKNEYDQKEKEEEMNRNHPSSIVYNLYGANTRVNNHSNDNSTNIIDTSSNDLFDEIRNILKESIKDEEELKSLRNLINDMESKQKSSEFNNSYTKFITSAANHMTILAPVLPALSQMIHS